MEKLKCIVMDGEKGTITVIPVDRTQLDEVEEILAESYEMNLSAINYMVVKELKIEVI